MGGRVAQSPECAAYVDCITALDREQGLTTNLARFEAGGVCWGNAEISDLCTTGCARTLERLSARTPSLPEACTP